MISITNAAGQVKKPEEAEPLLRVPADLQRDIILGSFTPPQRDGNSGAVFEDTGNGWLNALSMPNVGFDEMLKFLPTVTRRTHDEGKRVRVNIAAFDPNDYIMMTMRLFESDADGVDHNYGCPNVRKGGVQEPIFSFQPPLVKRVLSALRPPAIRTGRKIRPKLSPYSNPADLVAMASVIADFPDVVDAVQSCNTFPNAYAYRDNGKPLITANDGYAGLSGPPLKHIALGQVRRLRELLPASIAVHGIGGISSARDVRDMEWAGASEVQIGTAFFNQGPRIFQSIAEEYVRAYED